MPRRFLAYLYPQRRSVALASAALVLQAITVLAAPWPLKFVIDSVLLQHALPHWLRHVAPDPVRHRIQLLEVLTIAAIALNVANAGLNYFGTRSLLRAGQRAILALRLDVFAPIQRLSLDFHRRRKAGELMTRLGGDIQTLQEFVVGLGTGLFSNLITVAAILALIFVLDRDFTIVLAVALPAMAGLSYAYMRRMRSTMRRARRKEGELWGMVGEIIGGIDIVQAYGREKYEDRRFRRLGRRSLNATLDAGNLQAQLPVLLDLSMALTLGATLWFGTLHVIDGTISAGLLLVFVSYLRTLASPLRQIAKLASSLGKTSVALERIGEILAIAPDIADAAGARAPAECSGAIRFSAVTGRYGGDAALDDVTRDISAGAFVAFVGRTGAGKSTLASLVPRFRDPASGTVSIDGRDVRELPLAFVRNSVAIVTQEPLLFAGSVWDNVAYGREGATRDEAIAAAESAGIGDILESLPDGYDTVVGERGGTLSGGQRQCVAIARAMLRNAPIVVLDEPTSSLDPTSERRIVAALRRLTLGRTTIAIAHRLSTVAAADDIVVLDEGRVVERGTHAGLIAAGGPYSALWNNATDAGAAGTADGVSR